MTAQKQAAVTVESIADKPLNEISAADFLAALNRGDASPGLGLSVWPEKKKYELLLEPENSGGVRFGEFRVVVEKKKYELEKALPAELVQLKKVTENVVDPRTVLRDPAFIKELATEVAKQIQRM